MKITLHDPPELHAVIKVVIAEVAAAYFIAFVGLVVIAGAIVWYATGK